MFTHFTLQKDAKIPSNGLISYSAYRILITYWLESGIYFASAGSHYA